MSDDTAAPVLKDPCLNHTSCECLAAPCWYGYSMMFGFAWEEVLSRQEELEILKDDPDVWSKAHSTEYFIARLRAAGLHTMVSSDADNCYVRVGARMGRLIEEANRIGFRKRFKDECLPKPGSLDAGAGAEVEAEVGEKCDSGPDSKEGHPQLIDLDPLRAVRQDVHMAIHAPFQTTHMHLFARSILDPTALFSSAERQVLTQSIVEAAFADSGANINIDKDIVLWGYKLGSPIMLHDYEERTRLQMLWSLGYPVAKLVQKQGYKDVFWRRQPFHEIREYYGETITLYYAWMEHYLHFLVPAAIFGAVCWCVFIAGVTEAVYPYGLFIIGWASLFLEYWKRRESDLAFMWDVYQKPEVGREHPEFPEKSVRRAHPITGIEENYFPPEERTSRVAKASLVTALFLVLALGFNFGAIYLGMNGIAQPFGNIVSALGLVVCIEISKFVFTMVAQKLTDWETHKMLASYDQSLGVKLFAFEFCVKFASVFIVAFVKGYLDNPANDNGSGCNPPEDTNFCHRDLQIQVLTVFGTEMTVGQFTEVVIPLVKQRVNAYLSEQAEAEALAKLKEGNGVQEDPEAAAAEEAAAAAEEAEGAKKAEQRRCEDVEHYKKEGLEQMGLDEQAAALRAERMATLIAFRRERAETVALDGGVCKVGDGDWVTEDQENEAEKGNYWLEGGDRPDYQEMCIQFGWIAIFSMGFMMAPFLAWLNNIVEIRTDSLGMDQTMQRPQFRSSSGLGVWYSVLQFICYLSIMSNMLMFLKFNQISDNPWFDAGNDYDLVIVLIASEHFVILVKILAEVLIPDTSQWLEEAIESHDFLAARALGTVLDVDAEDIEAKHVLPHVASGRADVQHHYAAYFKVETEVNDMHAIKMGTDPSLDEKDDEVSQAVGVPLAPEEQPPNSSLGQVHTYDECPEKLKALINLSFTRYDLDDSGWIDGEQELHQLCTNLAYSLQLDQGFECIWEEVKIKGKDVKFDVPMFAEWFLSRFKWEFVDDALVCSGLIE